MGRDARASEGDARSSVDRLALALEDAGFDVGQEFPALHDAIGYQGQPVVRIGDVVPSVADRLATALINGLQSEEVVDR
jgi:hypothetical protein